MRPRLLLLLLPAVLAADTLSLSLDDALRLALKHSPARIEASVSRTQSGLKAANAVAALLPTPSASLGWARTTSRNPLDPETTLTGDGWAGTFTVSQVIFDPRVFAAVVSGFVYSDYYAADARDKQARLVLDVATGYLNLLKARLLSDAAASALARAGDNLDLTRDKLRLGSASRIDVMRAEVFRSQAEISRLTADRAAAAANAGLLATLGETEEVVVRPTEELTRPAGFTTEDPDSLIAEVERRNPGVRLAARVSSAAGIGLAGAAAAALPSVSGYWRSTFSDTLMPRSISDWKNHDDIAYGIGLSLPLLDLKSYVLNVLDASASARLARAAAARARLSIRSAAVTAVLGYREALQQLDYARRNLELNQELYRLARQQRELGALSLLDFFSVETALQQAQASHIGALCDTYIQAAQINYLLGRAELPVQEEP